jgi:hypothetical protein
MRFTLPSLEEFFIKDCVIAGEDCVLVTPKDMSVNWNEDNKYFRSSIWRKSDMHPVSLGFRKFMNYGEKPNFESLPEKLTFRAVQKIDGSCLIVSNYKDELIVRTRGTIDATQLDNGFEIELLKKKYPKAFDNEWLDCGLFTLLFEWTTPTNRIVLNETAEPTLWLIGMVRHSDYSYASQHNLNVYAKEMEVERPKSFGIRLSDNVEDFKKSIEPLKDIEGVVIYDETDKLDTNQILKKIKTLRYLELHRVFTGVKTVDHLFDIFVEYNQPPREEFEKQLATNFDWELVTTLKPLLDELYEKTLIIAKKVFWVIMYLQNPDFVELDRKGKAQKILELFPEYAWIGFSLLDGKELDPHKLWKTFTNSCS